MGNARRMRRTVRLSLPAVLVLVLLVLVLLAASGCGASNKVTVTYSGVQLHPVNLAVSTGTVVTWINGDQTAHSVTSEGVKTDTDLLTKPGPNEFNSGPLNPGEKFSYTFSRPGTYKYYDSVQIYITGVVTVQ